MSNTVFRALSYDFSFLTSPKDPRSDSWIGQQFMLSYLNSEPGINFPFRYKPFSINRSRIDTEKKYAERNNKRSGDSKEKTLFFDRIKAKDSHVQSSILQSIRPTLEGIASKAFIGHMKELEAIVESLSYFNAVKALYDTTTHDDDSKGERILQERFINPIVLNHRIYGDERIRVTAMIIELYKKYAREIERGSIVTFVDLLERVEQIQPSLHIGKTFIGHVKTILEGKRPLPLFFGTQTPNRISQAYAAPFIVDKAELESEIEESSFKTERITAFDTDIAKLITAKNKNQQKRSIAFSLLMGTIPNREGRIRNDLLTGNEDTKVGVQSDGFINTDKSFNKDSIAMEAILAEKELSKEGLTSGSYTSVDDFREKEIVINEAVVFVSKSNEKEMHKMEPTFLDRNIKSKDIFTEEYHLIDYIHAGEAQVANDSYFFDYDPNGKPVFSEDTFVKADIYGSDAMTIQLGIQVDFFQKESKLSDSFVDYKRMTLSHSDARLVQLDFFYDKHDGREAIYDWYQLRFDKQSTQAQETKPQYLFTKLLDIDARLTKDKVLSDKVPNDAHLNSFTADALLEEGNFDTRIEEGHILASPIPLDGFVVDDIYLKTTKMKRDAYITAVLASMTLRQKAGLIVNNLTSFERHAKDGYNVLEDLKQRASINPGDAKVLEAKDNVEKAIKDYLPILLIEYLKGDVLRMDGYIRDMIGISERSEEDMQADILDALKLGDEPTNEGIIQYLINANDKNENTREAYIPKEQFVLVSDGSDWDDIWSRYSPGVDILDPPDSDYDYNLLANQVYDPDTGVPYNPLSATNVADVKVKTPLHHPIPEHADVGIDDTKEIIVDNYFFIDTVLAIESIKTRNKLRYAGMSAEKTVRELFSKLHQWIQQAAPGSLEYERVFRFARWYAESAILRQSEHILHRTYNAWRSSLHQGNDLGVYYTQTGWKYFQTASVMQTIGTYSEMRFVKENYIDGQIIVRGYFDNPLAQGTMDIKIDGNVVDTVAVNGAFTRTIDVPQGNHSYEFIFNGNTGTVSLSTIEITGCEFVSAYTTSDDSNANGLKTVTTLINMLLSYFEQHHGSRKTKGTMAIKQRKVWNVQT